MRAIAYALGLLSAVGHVSGAPLSALTIFEKLGAVPQGWTKGEAADPDKVMRFRIAMTQKNAHTFEQHVIDISTPDHPKYGDHMSYKELKRALRPDNDATEAVLGWLKAENVKDVLDDGEWINFAVPIRKAEQLLDTKFHEYTNDRDGMKAIRTLQYSVPKDVTAHVRMIQPTIRFGNLNPMRSTAFRIDGGEAVTISRAKAQGTQLKYPAATGLDAVFCNTTITPDCLRDLYQVPRDYKANPKNGNKLGIAGYLEQYAKYDDLEQFLKAYTNQDPAKNNFSVTLINGGLNDQNDEVHDDVEANLDVQYAMSMAYETPTTYYSTGGRGLLVPDLDQPDPSDNSNEPYLEFLTYLTSLPDKDLPKTLTTSYGEDEQSVPESYTNVTCSMFARLGARGVSVLFSSGDTGVGSACQSNDGKNTTRFLPIYPASCPFVTSVGGTYRVQPERAIAFSSGGFSDRWPRPAYQDQAVKDYLAILGDRWKGLYNPNGRGFPDIAAQSYNYSVVDNGTVIRVGGTSASCPTVAGIITLLNSARLDKGRKPLGFLNPWIYSTAKNALTDIVDGGSRGCTGTDIYSGLPTPFVPYASWNATKGWDPVTGWGTPIFPKLLKLATEGYGY